jgi:predicted nucleotidyltransferase component of viral defense system
MIRKQDVLDRASEWQLRPEIVEKDYVLGWLLAGIASSDQRESWVFKGGTCIKKCFFETYRFSEDLDFSLLPDALYAADAIRATLVAIVRSVHELSGIDFPENLVDVRPRQNQQNQLTFQCRIGYRGPLAVPGYPRVLFDLTQHEPVLDTPEARSILHPYPDQLPRGATVLTYSLDELLGEKTRALYERTRPRDLYDVLYLLENQSGAFDLAHVRALFAAKCEPKSLPVPTLEEITRIVRSNEELRSEWENMLAHQLPVLPALDGILERLSNLLQWVEKPEAVPPARTLPPVPIPAGAVVFRPAGIRYWGGGSPLEAIRFAGANRLLIEFDYNGRHRVAEPYSLRTAETTGNLLLYAWESGATHIKAFNVANMSGVRATGTSFQPRYQVELTPSGAMGAPPTARVARTTRDRSRPSPRRRGPTGSGPTYVFECTYCGKHFRHSTNNSTLRRHKDEHGWDCPGRTGYLIQIE